MIEQVLHRRSCMNDASPVLLKLFQERRNVFLRVLTRRLGNLDEAEETLQEAFIHFDRATKKETINNPEAYLMQIALNLAVDRIRQNAARRKREENWFEANAPSRLGAEYVAPLPAPDQSLIAKDDLRRLSTHMEELSPKVRTAFIFHKILGMSHSETAAEMGLSKSTVEKHIMKAMRLLMDKMRERDA